MVIEHALAHLGPRPRMLKVYRSETQQYVVVHEPTHTVVLGDSFDEAFDTLRARLGDRFADAATAPDARPAAETGTSRGAQRALLGLLVLLPFVWLGALHLSLGALVQEFRTPARPAGTATEREEPAAGRAELDALARRVDRIASELRKKAKETKRKRAAVDREAASEAGEPEDETSDAGDEPGGDEDDTDGADAEPDKPPAR